MNLSFAASVAEIVSAYPTSGGLYTVGDSLKNGQQPDRRHLHISFPKAIVRCLSEFLVLGRQLISSVGWSVGYLNILGQIAGCASTEWGLAGVSVKSARTTLVLISDDPRRCRCLPP